MWTQPATISFECRLDFKNQSVYEACRGWSGPGRSKKLLYPAERFSSLQSRCIGTVTRSLEQRYNGALCIKKGQICEGNTFGRRIQATGILEYRHHVFNWKVTFETYVGCAYLGAQNYLDKIWGGHRFSCVLHHGAFGLFLMREWVFIKDRRKREGTHPMSLTIDLLSVFLSQLGHGWDGPKISCLLPCLGMIQTPKAPHSLCLIQPIHSWWFRTDHAG